MRKAIFILVTLLVCAHIAHAQELFRAKTAISLNMGVSFWGVGSPGFFFEQELVYWPKRAVSMGFRLGARNFLYSNRPWGPLFSSFGSAYLLTGRKNHHFEAALGAEFLIPRTEFSWPVYPEVQVGYRYQKPSSGLFVRGSMVFGGPSIGLGYSFPVKNK